MTLESHLRTLLYDHDCVIIPDFGGFLTRYRPAHIHALQHTLVPPSKVVTFNRKLVSNDGLIAQEIMRREGVSFDEAMALIAHRVSEMEADLARSQRLVLEGIGVIHQDPSGILQFTPATGQNFLKDAFGLEAVVLESEKEVVPEPEEVLDAQIDDTPVIAITPAATVQDEPEVHVERTPVHRPRRRRWMVAAAALPIIAAGMYFMRDRLPENFQALGFLDAPSPVVKSGFVPRFPEEDIVFTDESTENRIATIAESNPGLSSIYFDFEQNEMSPDGIRVILDETAEVTAPAPQPERSAQPSPRNTTTESQLDLYFVVGGAFSEKSNAERLVQTLKGKGFDAYVFGKQRGLHLVCYGSYTNQAAALDALHAVKDGENAHAWLKRP